MVVWHGNILTVGGSGPSCISRKGSKQRRRTTPNTFLHHTSTTTTITTHLNHAPHINTPGLIQFPYTKFTSKNTLIMCSYGRYFAAAGSKKLCSPVLELLIHIYVLTRAIAFAQYWLIATSALISIIILPFSLSILDITCSISGDNFFYFFIFFNCKNPGFDMFEWNTHQLK